MNPQAILLFLTPILEYIGTVVIARMLLPLCRTMLINTLTYVAQRQGAETVTEWLHAYHNHHKNRRTTDQSQ